ncbi:MAG: ATP-binding protein [Vicinamibacteria bacterium]
MTARSVAGRSAFEPDSATLSAALTLRWLIQVRWAAFAAQILAILGVWKFFEPSIAARPLLGLSSLVAITNLWAARPRAHVAFPHLAGGLLFFDTLLLTAMLFFASGVANPFSIFYLVNIALAAVVLSAGWTTVIAVVAIAGYGVLFAVAPSAQSMDHARGFEEHLRGMWAAFVLSAFLVSFFVVRLRAMIEQRDAELVHERARTARSERLAALVTLAGGAAHELATPLGTIAMAAGELERGLKDSKESAADLRLIRSEVERCRAILDDMAAGSGTVAGELPIVVRLSEVIEDCRTHLMPADRVRVAVNVGAQDVALPLPIKAFRRCLITLVRNAIDASSPEGRVEIRTSSTAREASIAVVDHGTGMSVEELARAGEPFWSSKPPGQGMGLGLFLVRATLKPLGGRLGLESAPGHGTTATVFLPLEASRA